MTSKREAPYRNREGQKMSDLLDLITVSQAEATDLPFIYNSWIRSHADGRPQGESYRDYCDRQHATIERLLDHADVLVARDTEDPDFIYGYLVSEQLGDVFCGHWLYVKDSFRRSGVSSLLLSIAVPSTSKHGVYTHMGEHFDLGEHLGMRYVPVSA